MIPSLVSNALSFIAYSALIVASIGYIDDPHKYLEPLWAEKYDWKYTTVPQPGINGQTTIFPR
jgi:hypothetical protein